jgi:hypothetical protein
VGEFNGGGRRDPRDAIGATSRRAAAPARDDASIPAAIAEAADRRDPAADCGQPLRAGLSFEIQRFCMPDRLHNRRSQWW